MSNVARTRPTVIDGTATEQPIVFVPPARRTGFDTSGVGLLVALLLVVVTFAGVVVNLTPAP